MTRVDRDTVRRKGSLVEMLEQVARREVDVLIGTQMIAKGHDFPECTLVGVISADLTHDQRTGVSYYTARIMISQE